MARRISGKIESGSAELFAPEAGFPDFSHEEMLLARGARYVAGVDEAGRGPLAGPVVVAAVRLDPTRIPAGLNDSKKLTAERRDALFDEIMACAEVAVVSAPPSDILNLNIRGATLAAMARAVRALPGPVDRVLVDGRDVPPELPCPGIALIGGDGRSVSIAAASIVAKVTRDRMCQIMDCDAPSFGFAGHKGYGTAAHLSALDMHGPCRHHREAFAPVAALLIRKTTLVVAG
jgi:ribonuclease HII